MYLYVFYSCRMTETFRNMCVVTFLTTLVCIPLSAKSRSWNGKHSRFRTLQLSESSKIGDNIQSNRNADVVKTDISNIEIHRIKRYLPRKRDLRPRKLFRLIGKKFNAKWMSADKPLLYEISVETLEPLATEDENSILDIMKSSDTTTNLNDEKLITFQTLLLERMSCPVEFQWKDIGPLFWPRYVKEGTCQSKQSCSFPTGMKCVPHDFEKLHILKWQCTNVKKITIRKNKICVTEKKTSKSRRHKLDCRWKQTRFRVLKRCVCSC